MAQLSKGTTYADGMQVTHTNLNNLVDGGSLAVGAITDQSTPPTSISATADKLLVAQNGVLVQASPFQIVSAVQGTQVGTTLAASAATGTSSYYARQDHVHPVPTLSGDASGTTAATVVTGIQGKPVSTIVPGTGAYLRFNGTSWEPTQVSIGTGRILFLSSGTFSIDESMIPAGVTSVRVHMCGAGGGAAISTVLSISGTTGGPTSINVGGLSVTCEGGKGGVKYLGTITHGAGGNVVGGTLTPSANGSIISGTRGQIVIGTVSGNVKSGNISMGGNCGETISLGASSSLHLGGACGSGEQYTDSSNASYGTTGPGYATNKVFKFLSIGGGYIASAGAGAGGSVLNASIAGAAGGAGAYATFILPISGATAYADAITVGAKGASNGTGSFTGTMVNSGDGFVSIEW